MSYEEVETLHPAGFVPKLEPSEEQAKPADEPEQVKEDGLLAEVVVPSDIESEAEDAACGGMRQFPANTHASAASEFSVEVGDESEQVAIAIDSPFNKIVTGGSAEGGEKAEASVFPLLKSAPSKDASVRSNRSTRSNRSISSKASVRSIKSKKSSESAKGGSVKSVKEAKEGELPPAIPMARSKGSSVSNRSVGSNRSSRSTGSKRLVKKSASKEAEISTALVVAKEKEVVSVEGEKHGSKRSVKKSASKEAETSTALVVAEDKELVSVEGEEQCEMTSAALVDAGDDKENTSLASGDALVKRNSKNKVKWIKKVSLSIRGYKTSFQFSDPMANLADAVDDALDVVGNEDENLIQQAKDADDNSGAKSAGKGKGGEEEDADEERDYDANPTRLFMYLQQRAWGLALTQLQEHPDEARVWVYRKAKPEKAPDARDAGSQSRALVVQHRSLVAHDGSEPPKIRWKILPLHAAIVLGAPTKIVQDIVRAYPNAAEKTDERGSLPVHLAASRLDVDPEGEKVMLQLFGTYPDSIEMQDRKGRTPPELAKLARARKDIEEQRKINAGSSQASQMGMECTMSQHGRQPSVAGGSREDDDEGDGESQGSGEEEEEEDTPDDRSTGSGISGRFRMMLRKSKSTDTVDRRKKKKKKEKGDKKSIKAQAGLSSAKSMDGGADEPVDDKAIVESLGPGFAFLTASKSQEIRERAASDDDIEAEEEKEPMPSELLKTAKQAISGEYQTPEDAPGDISNAMSIPLPMSFSIGDDASVKSGKSLRSKTRSCSPTNKEEDKTPPFQRTSSGSSATKLRRSSGSSGGGSTSSAGTPTKKVSISEEPAEVHEMARQAEPEEIAQQSPQPVQNEGLRVLLEKAAENAGRGGMDVAEFVEVLEDEWVTDVEALRRLDEDALDYLLPLVLGRELRRLIDHADGIDRKFLEEDEQRRGRGPKKSGEKKKKKKRSHRRTKKRGRCRPVTPPDGPLTTISEEDPSPSTANGDDCHSVFTVARSVHSHRSAPPKLPVPDVEDEEDDDQSPTTTGEEGDDEHDNDAAGDEADDDYDEILQSTSIEDLEIRKLHANLIADARKKFPTREALEDAIAERQSEVEAAVNSGFDVDKQTLARAALADDEVRKLLPLRLILPTVTDLTEMIGVLQVHKEGAMRSLNMEKARNIQSEIDELQDQINKEERYLLKKRIDETPSPSPKKLVGILRPSTKSAPAPAPIVDDDSRSMGSSKSMGSKSSKGSLRKDVETVDSRDDDNNGV